MHTQELPKHSWSLPLSSQSVGRLPSLVFQHHHANKIPSNFKNQMIGKTAQIASPTPMINLVKAQRFVFDSIKRLLDFTKKQISGLVGTKVIVIKRTSDILLNQRMNNQLHRDRDARMSFRSSSFVSPFTAPDHNSSPRLIASVRLSSSESFGSAPSKLSKSIAARSARSPSFNFKASIPISESFMR